MKAPAFWYRPRRTITAFLLSPVGRLYRAAGGVRRAMTRPYRSKIPVICVGNIVAGGSGKTPTAIAFARLLRSKGQKPVFVSRGYGGREKGPLRVNPAVHTARDVGDEALLLARVAPTWIGANRAAAIRQAEKAASHIILDDGLQNPTIHPSLSFLVINGAVGFGNRAMIPAGPLRENLRDVLDRVSAAILIGERDDRNVTGEIHQPVFRARSRLAFPPSFPRDGKFFAFAGIAHPERFFDQCKKAGLDVAGTRAFGDHHVFSAGELKKLTDDAAKLQAKLVTTEKDWVRLPPDWRKSVLTIPVNLSFDYPQAILRLFNVA